MWPVEEYKERECMKHLKSAVSHDALKWWALCLPTCHWPELSRWNTQIKGVWEMQSKCMSRGIRAYRCTSWSIPELSWCVTRCYIRRMNTVYYKNMENGWISLSYLGTSQADTVSQRDGWYSVPCKTPKIWSSVFFREWITVRVGKNM